MLYEEICNSLRKKIVILIGLVIINIQFLRGSKLSKNRLENKNGLGISVNGFLRSHLILERKIRHLYNADWKYFERK